MARTVCTYGYLDLNDGVSYFLMPGFNPGQRAKTYDEVLGYGGGALQLNVTEAHLITMTVPLRVQAASMAGLDALIDALNVKVDEGAQPLLHGVTTYACVLSPRVGYPHDADTLTTFSAFVTFSPIRTP